MVSAIVTCSTLSYEARSSISSTGVVTRTEEDSASASDLTVPSSIAAEVESEQFLQDMQTAFDLSLKETVSTRNASTGFTVEKPFKILKIVTNKKQGLATSEQRHQIENSRANGSEVISAVKVDLDNMLPLEVQRASEHIPESSFLALGEGNYKKKKQKGRADLQKRTEPVLRMYNDDTDTVSVSAIFKKREGGANGLSYYDVTRELYYLR